MQRACLCALPPPCLQILCCLSTREDFSHVVGRLGQVFELLRGWVVGGRLGCWVGKVTLSNGARLVLSCYALAAQMFGFRMQFVPVQVSLRRRWGQVAC